MPSATDKEVLKHYRMLTKGEAFTRTVLLSLAMAVVLAVFYWVSPMVSILLSVIAVTFMLFEFAERLFPAADYDSYEDLTRGTPSAPDEAKEKEEPTGGDSPHYAHSFQDNPRTLQTFFTSREGVALLKVLGSIVIAYPLTMLIYSLEWLYSIAALICLYGEFSYTGVSLVLKYIEAREIDEFPSTRRDKLMLSFWKKFSHAQGYYFIGLVEGKRVGLPRMGRFTHVLIGAPTGQGKSTGAIIPQLLHDAESKGSALVPDMKSPELHNIVASRWLYYGKRAFLFDPWHPDTVGINFLPGADDKDLLTIVGALMAEKEDVVEKEEAFFKSRTKYLLYAILKLVQSFSDDYCNMATAYFAVQSVKTLEDYIKAADDKLKPLFTDFGSFGGESKLNALTSIREKLEIFMSPQVRTAFSRSEFNLRMLFDPKSPCLLVIGAPMDQEEPGTRIASMITNLVVNMAFREGRLQKQAAQRGETVLPPNDLYLYLDELRNLRVEGLAKLVSIARGIRTGIIASVTDLGFLKFYHRGVDFSSLMGNFRTKIYMKGLDLDSCRYISESMGDEEIPDYKWVRDGLMTSRKDRKLLKPNEVMQLEEDEMIVFTTKTRPFAARTATIHNSPWLKKMQLPPPKNIRELYENWGIAKKPLRDPVIPMISGFPDFEKMKSEKPIVVNEEITMDYFHREMGGGVHKSPEGATGGIPQGSRLNLPSEDDVAAGAS